MPSCGFISTVKKFTSVRKQNEFQIFKIFGKNFLEKSRKRSFGVIMTCRNDGKTVFGGFQKIIVVDLARQIGIRAHFLRFADIILARTAEQCQAGYGFISLCAADGGRVEHVFDELAKIFRDYGEEKFAYKIATRIVNARENAPIKTTVELANIIAAAYPAAARRDGNPARKCFQALRIAVNGELDVLSSALDTAFELLKPNGVLAIITFHSLEDRMVKQKFKEYTSGCVCPPDFPVCVCGKTPRGHLLTRKPIEPTAAEIEVNPRSRSAKLRVIIKN